MPGVPSGKGCDGCRKQKKKCDQAKPQCSRCKRLKMPCTGSGQQRFKFIHSGADEGESEFRVSPPAQTQTHQVLRWKPHQQQRHLALKAQQRLAIVQMPATQTALIAGNLHSRLQVTDIRFDTSCFGSFLGMIPQRIGQNKALDAAADAFATAFNNLHSAPGQQSTTALVKHGDALREIRDALGEPTENLATESICAVYLTMVTESLVREDPGRHAEGMSVILTSGVYRKWKSRFELEMLTVMCFTILMECIGNPNLDPTPWLDEVLDTLEPRFLLGPVQIANNYPTLGLRFMADVVRVLREPWNRYIDILNCYEDLMEDRRRLRVVFNRVRSKMKAPPDTMDLHKAVRVLGVQLSVVTGMALALNGLLQQFDRENTSLSETREELTTEMLDLGELAMPHRPLGATHVLPGLNLVWAISESEEKRNRARDMVLSVYGCGFAVADKMQSPNWWRKKYADVRRQIVRQAKLEEGQSPDMLEPIEFKDECHMQ